MEEDVHWESEEWETPNNSVMPFGRIDLEIWLNTDLGMDFLGMDSHNTSYRPRYARRRHLGENGVIRNLLTATLSAANTVGRNDLAEQKLTNLAESLYTNSVINTDPFCCEFTEPPICFQSCYNTCYQGPNQWHNEHAGSSMEEGCTARRSC